MSEELHFFILQVNIREAAGRNISSRAGNQLWQSFETNTTFAAVVKIDVRIQVFHTELTLFEVEIQQIDERDKGT